MNTIDYSMHFDPGAFVITTGIFFFPALALAVFSSEKEFHEGLMPQPSALRKLLFPIYVLYKTIVYLSAGNYAAELMINNKMDTISISLLVLFFIALIIYSAKAIFMIKAGWEWTFRMLKCELWAIMIIFVPLLLVLEDFSGPGAPWGVGPT